MSGPALHPTPRPPAVAHAQVRAVGLSLRRPALAAAALAALVTAFVIGELVTGGGKIDFAPEISMVPGVLGLLFPFAVWQREQRFGDSFLWTLPVERSRHALARVFGGWVWLMAVVAAFVLWLLALALVSGGDFVAERTIQLLPSSVVPEPRTLDPSTLRAVRWAPRPLLWLAPFTGATGAYLLASAVAVGLRYPLRWLGGVVLLLFATSEIGLATHSRWLALVPSRAFGALLYGPYGFDTLLTGRTESLRTLATLADGRRVVVWRGLPDLGEWAAATLLWAGLGVAALLVAAARHRERRGR